MSSRLVKIISYFVRALGVFLILFTVLAVTDASYHLSLTVTQGTAGYETQWASDNDSILIISSVQKDYPAYTAGIRENDTIIKINDTRVVRNEIDVNKIVGIPEIGKKVKLTILKAGIERDYELVFVNSPLYEKLIELLFRIIPALLMLAYVIVGFWGIMKSPYSKETLLIAMFCFSFGGFMFSTISFSVVIDTFFTKYLYYNEIKNVIRIISLFGTSFWLLLFATFPLRSPFFIRHRIISYLFIFLLPLLIIISIFFELRLTFVPVFLLIVVNMAVGVFLLRANTSRVNTALEKRQIRLMFLGIKYGAISVGAGWLIIILSHVFFPESHRFVRYTGLIIFLLGEIGGLIIPFTFLNSFFQNRLLETETALKKRIRYTGVTLVMLSVYLSIIFLIGRLWINWFNITDPTLIIVFVLLVSLTFTPINKKILKWVDEKFYPERTKYTESLKHFIQAISGFVDSKDLLHHLSGWALNTTGVQAAIPVPIESRPAHSSLFRFEEGNSVIHRIRDGSKFFWDEITDRSRIPVNEIEFEWARDNDISVTIPMISHGELLGTFNIGKKVNSEDFTAEDLDILTQASYQTAMALQNIKLQSQYIEKKRMDKELEMARNIQKKLMPQIIPQVKGLDIIGECNPCHEVAGDYFDIINMEDGNTVLVVADVSGKGAGAAMIMANLQASIRLGVHLSDKLADFVTRINNLIHNNTSASEFITFFIAIWDPAKKVLYYVNAGHNPPIFIDIESNITRLEATGMILGVLPDQPYEEKNIRIRGDSLLVIYTDGLEEALDNKNEFYGQDRIIQTAVSNKHKGAVDISQALIDDVLRFCEDRPLHDDVTLIVAKGK
jgi:sigma-B regulation protein RsbU (phosphoserine phosphatase)